MIYTVTLNPSLDVTLWLDSLNPLEPVSVRRERIDPAGKAVNVSKVLASLGMPNRLYGLTGAENGERLRVLLRECGVSSSLLEVPGFVRENLSLILADGTLYKVDRAGFAGSPEMLLKLSLLLHEATGGEAEPLMVFAGSLPPGIGGEDFRKLILAFRERGARVVLDNDFFTWEEICSLSPFLIKPNEPEFYRLSGRNFRSPEELLEYAGGLTGQVEHVLVSMGASGLLYAGGSRRYFAAVPQVNVKSSVGAGDSTVAGFLAALELEKPVEDCVRFAAACGTAAVMTEGTGVLRPEEADALLSRITLRSQ